MAPKKHSHGKDAVSSSSTPPHFDRRRFWNAEAESNYASLLGKNMHRERGVDISQADYPFLRIARAAHWLNFVKHPGPAVASLVRDFYANLKVKHDEFKVGVRGKLVAFDSVTINALFDMPNYEEDGYRAFMSGTVDYMAIMQAMCYPGAQWKLNMEGEVVNFQSKYLHAEFYEWFVFVTSRIMPSNHTSQVTKERAALVYCISKRVNIDAGKLVQNSILNSVRGATTISMPHTSLITELCRSAGVTWDDDEELIHPRTMIDLVRRKRGRRGVVSDVEEDDPIPLQIQDDIPPGTERTMDERMAAMEQSLAEHRQQFDAHRRQVEEHMRFMHDFSSVLSHRFPSTSGDYMPFPQPPTWPSHSRSADNDDVDMGPGGGNEY